MLQDVKSRKYLYLNVIFFTIYLLSIVTMHFQTLRSIYCRVHLRDVHV